MKDVPNITCMLLNKILTNKYCTPFAEIEEEEIEMIGKKTRWEGLRMKQRRREKIRPRDLIRET